MNFKDTTLKEISGGGIYGLGAAANFNRQGPKFLRTTDIVSGSINWEEVPSFEESDSDLEKYLLEDGDIVISRTGANAGVNCYISNPPEGAIFAGYLVRFRIRQNKANAKYVSYVLKSRSWQDYVEATRTGSAQPQLNAVLMGNFTLSLPDLNVQSAVAKILGEIDEKIRINQQISKTLEEIAQTIFKSWFVDFDPVHAKSRGEKPIGMDEETAGLFPDSFEDSELGLIPSSWIFAKLGEIVDLSWGDTKTTKSSYVSSGYIAYSAKGPDGYLSKFDYSEPGIVLSAIGAGCGKTYLALGDWSCIKNTIRIVASDENPFAIPYVYLATNSVDFWEKRGSAQPFIGQEDARNQKIVFPSQEIQSKFHDLVMPFYHLANSLVSQNQKLIDLRDSLLPVLISGELEIPEDMLVS